MKASSVKQIFGLAEIVFYRFLIVEGGGFSATVYHGKPNEKDTGWGEEMKEVGRILIDAYSE